MQIMPNNSRAIQHAQYSRETQDLLMDIAFDLIEHFRIGLDLEHDDRLELAIHISNMILRICENHGAVGTNSVE